MRKYENAKILFVQLQTEDVITASGSVSIGGGDNNGQFPTN